MVVELVILYIPVILLMLVSLIIVFRVAQRVYYIFYSCSVPRLHHQNYGIYSPRSELEAFFIQHSISVSNHELSSINADPNDQQPLTALRYRRLGKGSNQLLLANGVGTDFFMWLPWLRCMVNLDPRFFDKNTLIVQSYRGLFHPDDSEFHKDIRISVHSCVEDMKTIMNHARLTHYDTIIGWSTGAQFALAFCARYPHLTRSLVLLNPSVGQTLHYSLQAVVPLPSTIRSIVSHILVSTIELLKSIITSSTWDTLKAVSQSTGLRVFLEIFSFIGGFPPEQAVYFHEYLRDVFKTRVHTRSLLDLILSLDEPAVPGSTTLSQPTIIFSGLFDNLTGVYLSYQLQREMKGPVKQVTFTMGSHFILLEWPDVIAKHVIEFIYTHSSSR